MRSQFFITYLLNQIQTLAVVHPVDVDPNQTFPAETQKTLRTFNKDLQWNSASRHIDEST